MKESNRKTIAIIVAAGRGNRFGSDLPKQFCNLGSRPMLMTTIDRFAEVVGTDNIIVVIDPAMEEMWKEMCACHSFRSPRLVYGGTTRWESVKNAIKAIDPNDCATVMVHDGARPLVTADFLSSMTELPDNADGMIPATTPVESLRHLEEDGINSRAVDRSRFVAVQTPQVFRYETLRESYALPYRKEFTDDASVVESAGFNNIMLAQGQPTNLKITNPLDIVIAEAILKQQKEGRR